MTATEAPTRYVTLAYGPSPGVYRQSLMLLVSLVAHATPPYELVVATDRPECYVWFGTSVDIEYLDRSRLDAWRGADAFSMRQKLELLRAVWPAGGAVTLLDADVLVTADLGPFVRQLQAGAIFMHKKEYVLSESRRAGNRRLWSRLRAATLSVPVAADDAMWNSGVIALPAADRPAVEQALATSAPPRASVISRRNSSSKASSSRAPDGCAPRSRGSRTTGATRRVTTRRSRGGCATPSSKGCR